MKTTTLHRKHSAFQQLTQLIAELIMLIQINYRHYKSFIPFVVVLSTVISAIFYFWMNFNVLLMNHAVNF